MDEIHVCDKTISDNEIITEPFSEFFINMGPKLTAESTRQSSNNVKMYMKNISNIPPVLIFVT